MNVKVDVVRVEVVIVVDIRVVVMIRCLRVLVGIVVFRIEWLDE